MANVLCIDPGVHENALAMFVHGDLTWVLLQPWDVQLTVPGIDVVVVEQPQFDGRPPGEVIRLMRAGAYAAGRTLATETHWYEPRDWKGSLPKPVHHTRIWEALTPREQAEFPAGTKARIDAAVERGARDAWRNPGVVYYGRAKGALVHNLLDAAGLGLFHIGRIER